MSPESKGHDPRAIQARNAELILNRLSDYLAIRFDLAGRINLGLRSIKQDLLFHELTNVRRCLMGDKIYGPIRMGVTDVFLGDDDKKRRALMSASDQTSIQVELVSHCQDDRVESTRGQIRIHDLKTFYSCIDSSLADFMDLVETWIWWDLLDSAEIVRFEQKMSILALARQQRLSEEMRRRYVTLIHPPSAEEETPVQRTIGDEDVIRYEFKQLCLIRDQWRYRRGNERGFMYVLKRDELPGKAQGEAIHKIAELVREYDRIDLLGDLDEETRIRYAPDLRVTPERVTRQAVLDYVQKQMLESEREMVREADHDAHLGPPYNYKEKQFEQMDRVLADLAGQLKAVLQPAPPPAAPKPAPAVAAPMDIDLDAPPAQVGGDAQSGGNGGGAPDKAPNPLDALNDLGL